MIKHKEKYTEQQRYDFAMKIENHMRRRARTKTDVFGRENLPQDGGYIMYANHQGKYDALGIMLAHPKPCAMLWEEKSADRLVARQVCGLVEGTTISFEDPKQQIGALKTIYDSWRSMDTNTFEKVRTQVYFLPPIPYEEYGKLRKHDVCELVKKRIQEKLDELKEADPRR